MVGVVRLVTGLSSVLLLCTAGRPSRPRVQILHDNFEDDTLDDPVAPQEDDVSEKDAGVAGWPVVQLNEQIFKGNVLREDGDRVKHWFVYWCPDWWEPCKELMQNYTELATQWHEQLNEGALLTLPVRFARVNCATDKVLCNTMLVEDYPTIQHYSEGDFKALWTRSGKDAAKSMAKWINAQLREVQPATAVQPQQGGSQLVSEVMTFLEETASEYLVPGEHAVDVLLVVMLLLVNFWAVSHSPSIWQKDQASRGQSKKELGLDLDPNLALIAATREVLQAPGTASLPEVEEEEDGEQEPPLNRLERMLPEKWLTERATLEL